MEWMVYIYPKKEDRWKKGAKPVVMSHPEMPTEGKWVRHHMPQSEETPEKAHRSQTVWSETPMVYSFVPPDLRDSYVKCKENEGPVAPTGS